MHDKPKKKLEEYPLYIQFGKMMWYASKVVFGTCKEYKLGKAQKIVYTASFLEGAVEGFIDAKNKMPIATTIVDFPRKTYHGLESIITGTPIAQGTAAAVDFTVAFKPWEEKMDGYDPLVRVLWRLKDVMVFALMSGMVMLGSAVVNNGGYVLGYGAGIVEDHLEKYEIR